MKTAKFTTKRFLAILALSVLVLSTILTTNVIAANSAEGDPVPPSGGGGGGGGGGGTNYIYFIPLYFTKHYYNVIYITSGYQSSIQTDFLVNNTNSFIIEPGKTFQIKPEFVQGIANGSKIVSSSPVQIVIATENISQTTDISFAYTLLPMRIWGYKFVNTLPNATLYFYPKRFPVTITHYKIDSNEPTTITFQKNSKFSLKAQKGDMIISDSQIIIMSLSITSQGAQAEMLLPDFLKGKQYQGIQNIGNSDSPNTITFYDIYAPNKTILQIKYEDNAQIEITLQANTSLQLLTQDALHGNIRFITADQKITLTFKTRTLFGGTIYSSSAQIPALEEMNAAEFFALPQLNYDSGYQIFPRKAPSTIYNLYTQNNEYYLFNQPYNLTNKKPISYLITKNSSKPYLVVTTQAGSGLGYSAGPNYYPSQVSYAFPLVPLNPVSFNESLKGFEATWYRYTDLVIESITTTPKNPEELSSLVIYITIKNNGTLPSGRFIVEISVNDQLKVKKEISYLGALETYTFKINRFEGIGKHTVKVSVNLDPLNLVEELSEKNNQASKEIEVNYNIRFRVTVVLIIVGIIYWLLKKLYSKYKLRKLRIESEADIVLGVSEL